MFHAYLVQGSVSDVGSLGDPLSSSSKIPPTFSAVMVSQLPSFFFGFAGLNNCFFHQHSCPCTVVLVLLPALLSPRLKAVEMGTYSCSCIGSVCPPPHQCLSASLHSLVLQAVIFCIIARCFSCLLWAGGGEWAVV